MNASKPIFLLVAAAILVFSAPPGLIRPQQEKTPAMPGQGMQADLQAAIPGPAHKQMAKRVGEYTTMTKLWIKPATTPLEFSGTARISSILEGRFLLEENSSTMMGQRITGWRLYGYNNGSKKYESCWVFTASTAILTMSGTSDDDGKTVNYAGAFDDPSGVKQPLVISLRQVDDDHFVVNIRGADPNAPHYAVQETAYARKK